MYVPRSSTKMINGILDIVEIKDVINEETKSAYAVYKGLETCVANATSLVGEQCLVRFALKHGHNRLMADFVTTNIPTAYTYPLVATQYIFHALWLQEMGSPNSAPLVEELQQYYNPGRIGHYIFIRQDGTKGKGKIRVNSYGLVTARNGSNVEIIRNGLPLPQKFARLVVSGSKEKMDAMITATEHCELLPIVMQPIPGSIENKLHNF